LVLFYGGEESKAGLTRCGKTKEEVGVLRFLMVGRGINGGCAALAIEELQLEKKGA
jgi:hypothetical protein